MVKWAVVRDARSAGKRRNFMMLDGFESMRWKGERGQGDCGGKIVFNGSISSQEQVTHPSCSGNGSLAEDGLNDQSYKAASEY